MKKRGFTLVEVVVGVFIFLIIALGIYQGFFVATKTVAFAKLKTEAILLANEQFELIRNLPYQNLGIVNGLPAGVLPRNQTFARGGVTFNTTLTIRSIDDPFDGTIGGTPNDTAPADYKEVTLAISCSNCPLTSPLDFVTTVAPKNVESGANNGALFIKVVDAAGLPIPSASVHVQNDQATPVISVDETTNNNGQLQLVDVPPGANAYQVVVTKTGYSTEQTYPPTETNPNPVQPQSTVAVGQVTFNTLTIDRLSNLPVTAFNQACAPVAAVDFSLTGAKLIGADPDVYKYQQSFTTNGAGQATINDLEWDNYNLQLTGTAYDLVGITPTLPLSLSPDTTQNVSLVLTPHAPRALLVAVEDAATGLPVSAATTTLKQGETMIGEKLTSSAGGCWPAGQAWYDDLSVGSYELTVTRDGYQTYTNSAIGVSSDWQKIVVPLPPA
jgi:prepilin-type N-terminal cleavage/methylation domain-containing protein